jgi:deoxyhypusine synthase
MEMPVRGPGNHLVIEGFECNPEKLDKPELVKTVINEIANMLGMKRISETVVVKHAARRKEESGITGFVIIAESHISVHTYPLKGYVAVDVFSCREFDLDRVADYVKKRFDIRNIEKRTFNQGITSDEAMEKLLDKVSGFGPSKDMSVNDLVERMKFVGFQATHLSKAADIIRRMRREKARIFLTFTSNMVSSGLREIFAYLLKNKLVDVVITSVGSIEEDLMKSRKPFLLGSFDVSDSELHKKGINRIGNIFVPNDRYETLENLLQGFFREMLKKQKAGKKLLSPSGLIFELGKTVTDQNSILYWATKNSIPIFCPAITDGAFGLQVYFFKQDNPEFGIDVTADMNDLANLVLGSQKAGGIVLGGGVAKHHLIGANLIRDGLDYAVYVMTGTEYDGSLSGARVKEGVSWGKIKDDGENHVFVEGDATIIFPLLAATMKENK